MADPRLQAGIGRLGREVVREAVGSALRRVREGALAPDEAADAAAAALPASLSQLGRVLNATGVVVHTNLGRAPLSAAAVDALMLAAGNTPVEFDLATGGRGQRAAGALAALSAAVPEAEAVFVANNNAAVLAPCFDVCAFNASRPRARIGGPDRDRGATARHGDHPGAVPAESTSSATVGSAHDASDRRIDVRLRARYWCPDLHDGCRAVRCSHRGPACRRSACRCPRRSWVRPRQRPCSN